MECIKEYGKRAAAGNAPSIAPPPRAWQILVDESREFVSLFLSIPRKDAAFIW
jgi:hypothetical protein